MKNNDKSLWLWVEPSGEEKTDALLDSLALYLVSREEKIESVSAFPGLALAFATKYTALTGYRRGPLRSKLAYSGGVSPAPFRVSGSLIRPNPDQAALIAGFFVGFHKEAFGLELSFSQQMQNAALLMQSGMLYCWQTEGRLAAMGILNPYTQKFARLNYIYTSPPYRRRGYGKALVSSLGALAGESGLKPVLYTDPHNIPANRMYRSLHYEEDGQIDEYDFLSV